MEHTFTVKENDAGGRIDKFLCEMLPNMSRGRIKALLDDGRVLINRRRILIAGWELEAGDEIEIRIPPGFEKKEEGPEADRPEEKRGSHATTHKTDHHGGHLKIRDSIERHFAKKTPAAAHRGEREKPAQPRHKFLKIYFSDRDLIVVEKPVGIISVAAGGKEGGDMVSEVHAFLSRKHRGSRGSFVSPLHRLDAETSGIMVFALSKTGKRLEEQFKSHAIRREYVAIVSGRVDKNEGVIDIPLEKGDFHGGKKVRRADHGGGRRAVTEFRVKERYGDTTLLDVKVRTGRTHQIRVHLSEEGHPILGDKLYAEEKHPFARQALHASVIGFRHPASGKKMMFHSPLPRDMRELIDKLRQG